MRVLEKITIKNFKSIRDQTLQLGRLNVFIGGNGAGKSNLIQVFRFLREIFKKNLANYSLKRGVNSLLYFGRKKSSNVSFKFEFFEGDIANVYEITLLPTDEGTFTVESEQTCYHKKTEYAEPFCRLIGAGTREAVLADSKDKVAGYVRRDMVSYRVYHFHDTSDTALVKDECPIDDNHFLRADAANLAAFLYVLQRKSPEHFQNIENIIRQIAPFFERFQLEPSRLSAAKIRLEWKENGSDAYFNASALSDGTLRFMCLATLLLQPDLPSVILLDEPELGLHPAAVTILAELLESASTSTQVMVATQSVTLVNQLEPEHVWTVDREDGASVFRHLGREDMKDWLDNYALGELWEKNIVGARP